MPIKRNTLKFSALGLACVGSLCVAQEAPRTGGETEASDAPHFDLDLLKQRGIDPKLAEYLLKAPGFQPGPARVAVRVNGELRGKHDVYFLTDGRACFDDETLSRTGLIAPKQYTPYLSQEAGKECHDVAAAFPRAELNADVGALELAIVVPAEFVRVEPRQTADYSTGGVAGVLNYDASFSENRLGSRSSRFQSLTTEAGVNFNDWIVRSRQIHTSQDGVSNTARLETYAQKTFRNQRALLQMGEINLGNPILPVAQVTGVQVTNESALSAFASGARIEGIAQTQARVEVRQSGVLIHSTLVPAGPFSLQDVRTVNQHTEMQVTVIEADGTEHGFVVPMSRIANAGSGFVVGVGEIRNAEGSGAESQKVASAGWTGTLGVAQVGVGGVGAQGYSAVGLSADTSLWPGMDIQASFSWARASLLDESGTRASLSVSQRLSQQWFASVGVTEQSNGYRDLLESFETQSSGRFQSQYLGSLGWSSSLLGSLSVGYSQSSRNHEPSDRRATASWSRQFKRASVSASAEWGISGGDDTSDRAFLSVSIPLRSGQNIRTSVNRSEDSQRIGVSTSARVNDYLGYHVGVDNDSNRSGTDASLGLSLLPRYTRMNLGYTHGANSRSYRASATGGILFHSHGMTLSPYNIGDTFASVSLGDVSGVMIQTPNGPVWTDRWGQAVVAQLNPYGASQVEVATRTLPRDVDIENGAATLRAGRGAVERISMKGTRTRRLLLEVMDAEGNALPDGAPVIDGTGQFVTVVQGGGEVFLPNVAEQADFRVMLQGNDPCRLVFELGKKANPQTFYESASAVCVPVTEVGR